MFKKILYLQYNSKIKTKWINIFCSTEGSIPFVYMEGAGLKTYTKTSW